MLTLRYPIKGDKSFQNSFFLFAIFLQKKKSMKIEQNSLSFPQTDKALSEKKRLILAQFFLIIFCYHILKDLKDTLVITASPAGAEVIPFLKIWGILPTTVLVSYLFLKVYQRFGREKTLYIFITALLGFYTAFAFGLAPYSNQLSLDTCSSYLREILPAGGKGFISMICYWHYSLFYITAELWSMIILTILFWGYVNEESSLKDAKSFYPICIFVGNCAGILSGQISRYVCQSLVEHFSWHQTLQCMLSLVIFCGIVIMWISYRLSFYGSVEKLNLKSKSKLSFNESIKEILQSPQLLSIATIVIGFGLTSHLFEVMWKDNIKNVYPLPQDYNAYINQLTSIIGFLAVVMSLVAHTLFRIFSWKTIALVTPCLLFAVSLFYFLLQHLPQEHLTLIAGSFEMESSYLILTVGACYYVLSLTSKYTLFDMSKEMAFISVPVDERLRAKSIIDSIGSRLGKSGASSIYQVLLIGLGSTAGYTSFIGLLSLICLAFFIKATLNLGNDMTKKRVLVNQ